MSHFTVTEAAQRPARMDGTCFYCRRAIGEAHAENCVLVNRLVRIRMTIEYVVDVPAHWDKHDIEFHRNDGSWCCDNAFDELNELHEMLDEQGQCSCNIAKFEYLGEESPPYRSEQ
jgi:hypothetical protein